MRTKHSLALGALLGIGTLGAEATQMPVDFDQCFSGDLTVVTAGKALTAFGFEMTGVLRSNAEQRTLHDYTSHCVGLAKVVAGELTASAYCKFMSPEEDVLVVELAGAPKGTWTVLEGSGKWAGATGQASYERLTKTKPIKPGTVQHCYRHTGTLQTP